MEKESPHDDNMTACWSSDAARRCGTPYGRTMRHCTFSKIPDLRPLMFLKDVDLLILSVVQARDPCIMAGQREKILSSGADMSMTRLVIVGFLALAFMQGMSSPTGAEALSVGAPPTLRAAFEEIVPIFQQEYRESVGMVYAPSKAMLRQIERGAPIDVFVSAGLEEVEHLHREGLTLNGAPRVLAQTSLVLVMSSESPTTLVSFPDALAKHSTRIALGDPEISYLGEVTARALTKVYPNYKTRAHILYGAHTEDIVRLIHTGKAEVGLVYRANVINHADVRISDETPLGHEVRIQFGQAVVSTCRASLRSVAEQFSDFLMTPRILKLLEKYGFDAPIPTGRMTSSSPSVPSPSR